MSFIIDCLLWMVSHSPVLCFSDDKNYATLTLKNIKNRSVCLRVSILNLMFGDQILYLLTFCNKKMKLFRIIKLESMEGILLTDEKIEEIQKRFKDHIQDISKEELEIEKEALCYHIQNENARVETSVNKINIYATIILAILPLLLAILDFKAFWSFSLPIQIGVVLLVYGMFNICAFVFRSIKVQGIKKSSFQDLRNDPQKDKKIVLQFQYDWQQLKYKAQLFVSFVLNLQAWVIYTIALALIVTIGITYEQSRNTRVSYETDEKKVITINISEIDVSYSNSAVEWAKLIYEIEQKEVKEIIFITHGQVSECYIQNLEKYHELDIKITSDDLMDKNQLKIVKGS